MPSINQIDNKLKHNQYNTFGERQQQSNNIYNNKGDNDNNKFMTTEEKEEEEEKHNNLPKIYHSLKRHHYHS